MARALDLDDHGGAAFVFAEQVDVPGVRGLLPANYP